MWPRIALGIALQVNICRTALPANIISMSSCNPEPANKCPMLPRKFTYMWNQGFPVQGLVNSDDGKKKKCVYLT